MATATAPKPAPTVLPTTATPAPAATPAVAKESPLLTPPPLERKPSATKDASPVAATAKPKQPTPVKDVPKSPVNGFANSHANGHAKPHSKPGTPHSPLTRHPSGGDHEHPTGGPLIRHHSHGHGCACHKCIRLYNEVTHVGDAYCPNPNLPNIAKDYETKVRIIQRIPEMRKVEKTFFVKQLVHEDRTTVVRKSRIVMEDVEDWVKVPVIKEVPQLKTITIHKIHEEIRTVTDMVPVIEYERRCRVEKIPRVCMEEDDEIITVPVIKEVPEVVKVQRPTGEFCENPIEEYCTPGDFNLLCKDGRHHGDHHRHRSPGSSSSSDCESDDEKPYSPKSGKGTGRGHSKSPKRRDGPTPINTKPVQDYGAPKPLSPIKTKPVPVESKPHEEPRHDGPKPTTKPREEPAHPDTKDTKPKPKPNEEPAHPDTKDTKPKSNGEPKPKPHEEPRDTKPKAPSTDHNPKIPTDTKPKAPTDTKPKAPTDTNPKAPTDTKPKAPTETKPKPSEESHDTKPKEPTSNAPKRMNSSDGKPKAHEEDSSKKRDESPSKRKDSLLQRIIHTNQS